MLQQIIEIVKKAGAFMDVSQISVYRKGNASNYVTSADVNVQKFLYSHLKSLIPDSAFIGEESMEAEKPQGFTWVVDPIDGTSNFIRNIGYSSISVGLLKDGEPYMGVIYHPFRNEIFSAEKGRGAFLNGEPIKVSDRDFAHSHLCSAMSLYDKTYAPPCFRIIDRIYREADDLRRLGSAATELAYLAAGRVELYFEIRVFSWDVCAGIAIIKEAGGYVECLYEKKLPLDRPFAIIAANTSENFERLKTIVQEELPKIPYM